MPSDKSKNSDKRVLEYKWRFKKFLFKKWLWRKFGISRLLELNACQIKMPSE